MQGVRSNDFGTVIIHFYAAAELHQDITGDPRSTVIRLSCKAQELDLELDRTPF